LPQKSAKKQKKNRAVKTMSETTYVSVLTPFKRLLFFVFLAFFSGQLFYFGSINNQDNATNKTANRQP